MKLFKNRDKNAGTVDCEDAADRLLRVSGLRMTCPDDIEEETPTVLGADADPTPMPAYEANDHDTDGTIADCQEAADKVRRHGGLRMTCPDDIDDMATMEGSDSQE
jgi:hypothetical protein